jgi:hypothetical protein
MRPASPEIPERDATAYQNLMRQNPKLTRSRATKYPHTDEASYFQKMIFGGPLDIHLRSAALAGPLLFLG